MKTLTIEWLNKCRCGNKLHTVKTARGNESALWDDDAVKCDSCGRGGVIQVCEGQARVLWETDEEMVEGKPMSTITKEWLQQKIADMEAIRDDIPFGLGEDGTNTLAALRIALASLEAEPVAWLLSGGGAKNHVSFDSGNAYADPLREVTPLYTAPPAPVALTSGYSDFEEIWSSSTHPLTQDDEMKDFAWDIWNACRAAMLQGAEPVSQPCTLREGVAAIRNSGIAIDDEKIKAERDALNEPTCWCHTCRPVTVTDMRFIVCPDCGNKRCPHANDHRNACTGSNEPGQEGSAYPAAPQQEVTQALAKGMERYGDAMQKLADSGD